MFEATVDRFGRAIRGVGLSKWTRIPGSVFECSAQCDECGQAVRYAHGGHDLDLRLHQGLVCLVLGAR